MPMFEYEELPTPTSLRLLWLLRDADDKLSLSIEVFEQGARTYSALSYCWGDLNDTMTIQCNEKDLTITRTLYDALLEIATFPKRPLWVDQICINQKDNLEKSQQVQRMYEIYSKADTTWAWLGLGDESSEVTLDLIPQLVEENVSALDRILGVNPHKNSQLPPPDSKDWTHVQAFFNRSWFKRMWVVQEVCLSQDMYLLCGRRSTHWDNFVGSIETFHHRLPNLAQETMPAYSLSQKAPKDAGTTLTCLLDCTDFGVTDPRDKIYALLGLQTDFKLVPDYSKSVEQVYIDAAVRITSDYFDDGPCIYPLQILWATGHNNKSLPSWVPDWRNRYLDRHTDFSYMRAFRFSAWAPPSPTITADYTLVAHGFRISPVKQIEVTNAPASDVKLTASGIRRGIAFLDKWPNGVALVAADDQLSTFAHTVTAGRFHLIGSYLKNFNQLFADIFAEIMQKDSKVLGAHEWAELDMLQNAHKHISQARSSEFTNRLLEYSELSTANRCFATTESGQLVLGPLGMQAGDVVTMLCAANFLVVLRPIGTSEWKHVGSCYVEGVSMGEMDNEWRHKKAELEEFRIQ